MLVSVVFLFICCLFTQVPHSQVKHCLLKSQRCAWPFFDLLSHLTGHGLRLSSASWAVSLRFPSGPVHCWRITGSNSLTLLYVQSECLEGQNSYELTGQYFTLIAGVGVMGGWYKSTQGSAICTNYFEILSPFCFPSFYQSFPFHSTIIWSNLILVLLLFLFCFAHFDVCILFNTFCSVCFIGAY